MNGMEAISSEKTASDFVRSGNRTTFSHSERVIRRHSVAARPVADTCRKSCSTVKHRKPLPTVRTPSRCALFPITPLNIDSPIGRVKPRKMLNISSSCRAIASFRIQLAYLSDDKVSGRMGSGYMSDCERARYRAIPRSLSLYPAFRKQPTMRFVIPFGEPPRANLSGSISPARSAFRGTLRCRVPSNGGGSRLCGRPSRCRSGRRSGCG